LRELLARIEQLPASPESERMLAEVRSRLVDVDTGVTPRAMLPVDRVPAPQATNVGPAHAAKAVAPTCGEHGRGRPARPPQERGRRGSAAPPEAVVRSSVRTPAVVSAAEDREWLSLVATNEVLSLDNATPLPMAEASAGHDRRPWTRGLRG
jgi:hypothetical protein